MIKTNNNATSVETYMKSIYDDERIIHQGVNRIKIVDQYCFGINYTKRGHDDAIERGKRLDSEYLELIQSIDHQYNSERRQLTVKYLDMLHAAEEEYSMKCAANANEYRRELMGEGMVD